MTMDDKAFSTSASPSLGCGSVNRPMRAQRTEERRTMATSTPVGSEMFMTATPPLKGVRGVMLREMDPCTVAALPATPLME